MARLAADRVPLALVILLALAYLLPGLVGHDPWKQDETYIFGIVHHAVQTGEWVIPMMAGEPFMENRHFSTWSLPLPACSPYRYFHCMTEHA